VAHYKKKTKKKGGPLGKMGVVRGKGWGKVDFGHLECYGGGSATLKGQSPPII
jgi:hypothetical protein